MTKKKKPTESQEPEVLSALSPEQAARAAKPQPGVDEPDQADQVEVLGADGSLAPERLATPGAEQFWFHVGLLPHAPRPSLDCAGISFAKITERLGRGGSATHRTTRTPQIGCIVRLTRDQLRLLAKKVRQKVFRFVGGPPSPNGSGSEVARGSLDIGDQPASRRLPAAMLLHVPTPEEVAELKLNQRHYRPYVPSDADVGIAHYMFCVWLNTPSPAMRPLGAALPPSLAETGVGIPLAGAKSIPDSALVNPMGADMEDGNKYWSGSQSKPILDEHGNVRPTKASPPPASTTEDAPTYEEQYGDMVGGL